jgi:hypothetical protein
MKFNHVDGRLTVLEAAQADGKFQRLTLELGLREDNYHVGSGLGGNNFQLLTLMALDHNLVKRPISVQVDGTRMAWSGSWLNETPMKSLRAQLDRAFPTIEEHFKYQAVALNDLSKTNSMRDTVVKYPDQFPHLMLALHGKGYRLRPGSSYIEQYIMACIMCQELSSQLDQGDRSLIQPMGHAMADFPMEIVLLSVRKYVTLERLVQHNLDEDAVFGKVLSRINKAVD